MPTDLERIATVWTQTRSFAAARAWAALAPSGGEPVPTGRSTGAVRAWHTIQAERDLLRLPALLEALPTATSKIAADRIRSLGFIKDARVHVALVGWIETMPFRIAPAFWNEVFTRVCQDGPADVDWKGIAKTVALEGTNSALAHAPRVEALAGRIRPPMRALTDEESAWLAALGFAPPTKLPEAGEDTTKLWEAVYDNPGDLGVRAVLADALQLEENPRGEWIALQLRIEEPNSSQTQTEHTLLSERQRCLLAANGKIWLGPWVSALCEVTWRAGFPYAVKLGKKKNKLMELVDQEALRTVEHVSVAANILPAHRRRGLHDALSSGVFSNLCSIRDLLPEDLPRLRSTRAASITTLGIEVQNDEDLMVLCDELTHWPAVRSLFVSAPTPVFFAPAHGAGVQRLLKLSLPHLDLGISRPVRQSQLTFKAFTKADISGTIDLSLRPSANNVLHRQGRRTYAMEVEATPAGRALDVFAWHRAREVFEVELAGSPVSEVFLGADYVPALADLAEELPRIGTVRMTDGSRDPRGFASIDPFPKVDTWHVDLPNRVQDWVAALKARKEIRTVKLRTGEVVKGRLP